MSLPNAPKKYLVGGILVEAVKSEGGGFYELTVVATGDKQRYLADVFENVAEEACNMCFHSLKNNSHGVDQNDLYMDGDLVIYSGSCTYCKRCK